MSQPGLFWSVRWLWLVHESHWPGFSIHVLLAGFNFTLIFFFKQGHTGFILPEFFHVKNCFYSWEMSWWDIEILWSWFFFRTLYTLVLTSGNGCCWKELLSELNVFCLIEEKYMRVHVLHNIACYIIYILYTCYTHMHIYININTWVFKI